MATFERTPRETDARRDEGRDWVTVAILALLALCGLIPWVRVLAGEPPAYTAELGAAVTFGSLFALVPALRDVLRSREEEAERDADDPSHPQLH